MAAGEGLSMQKRGTQDHQDVMLLQQTLKNKGYYTGNIDGDFGPLTAEAVSEYRKYNNLGSVPTVDDVVWQSMGLRLEKRDLSYGGQNNAINTRQL